MCGALVLLTAIPLTLHPGSYPQPPLDHPTGIGFSPHRHALIWDFVGDCGYYFNGMAFLVICPNKDKTCIYLSVHLKVCYEMLTQVLRKYEKLRLIAFHYLTGGN